MVNTFHLLRRPGTRADTSRAGASTASWTGTAPRDQRLRRLPGLLPDPSEPRQRRHPSQRGHLPRDEHRRALESQPGAARCRLQFQLGSDVVICLDDCTDREAPARSRRARSSAPCAGPAAAARSSIARVAQRGRAGRRCSSPSSRAAASSAAPGCAAALADRLRRLRLRRLAPRWRRPAARRPAALAGRVAAAGGAAHALGIGRPDHVVTPPRSATRSSTARCRPATRATAGSTVPRGVLAPAGAPLSPGRAFYRALRLLDQRTARPRPHRAELRLPALRALLARLPAPPVQVGDALGRAPGHAAQPALLHVRPLPRSCAPHP